MNKTICGVILLTGLLPAVSAQHADWKHSGSIYLLTTPEGANLPGTASVDGFPVLVRLHKDYFDFSQAKSQGEDVRFSTDGKALPYQVEHWDAANGTASIWVRLPTIKGDARQEIRMFWGKADAASESSGAAVYNESNGYLSVWHMNGPVKDEVGTLESTDTGTTDTAGMIGPARHFPGGKGIFCGDKIPNYPVGTTTHSSEAWFRPEKSNSTVFGWGNEQGQGKVVMQYRSPPHVNLDCYFSDGNVAGDSRIPMGQWVHVVHTYQKGDSRVYVNGTLDGVANSRATPLNIRTPARMWIGGWYHNYTFVGDIDEARISTVIRSADWVRLQYENQKPLQTLAGSVVQPGSEFSVSTEQVIVTEGKSAMLFAKAGGAQKVYWVLKSDGRETIVSVDRFQFTFDAGRVTGDKLATLQFKGIYPNDVKTRDIRITIKEDIHEPVFTLNAPATWDGRAEIEVVPQITNLDAMKAKGAGELNFTWSVSDIAVIKEIAPGSLLLKRAQNSGKMTVSVTVDNGGEPTTQTITIMVKEPEKDAWVQRVPGKDEKPEDSQFYARDENNEGTLFYNGTLNEAADSVFLKVYADGQPFKSETSKLAADKSYAFSVKLKPGLIHYKVEFGSKAGDLETVLHTATNIVCGDAYLIDGQSNALATDTHEESPRETNEWIRSYGYSGDSNSSDTGNEWCLPVWKFERGNAHGPSRKQHKAELGWWGMELAKRLVESRKVPIFIINGAVGGTRIDQHQRNSQNHEDLGTIYGRMLWRVRHAKLTHGIRAVLWHQGENDQGAAGPDGGYGWQSYQRYFIEMSAAWKQDFPNIQHYYVFQIWPNSCSMGNGNGDMLREVQRTLPRLYSNMDVMSTLGIRPPGPCHFPLIGWAEFARLIQPLLERDIYGKAATSPVTPPNLKSAYFTGEAKDTIALEFDQAVVWQDSLVNEFYLDGAKEEIASGTVSGNVVTLKLKGASTARKITYLKEKSWSQDRLLIGGNGIAALSFCEVPILTGKSTR
ncbi:MAG: DUF2341 domain-containing protein [Planctomycetota bacterium]|nr:DUF2341 domain-containing protein [Planctomycetota bacterium]